MSTTSPSSIARPRPYARRGRRQVQDDQVWSATSPDNLPVTLREVILTDLVVDEIDRLLIAHEPERGGVGFSPAGGAAITRFLPDEFGETTSVSWIPGPRFTEQIPAVERFTGSRLAAVVHTHPGGLNQLSGPDVEVLHKLLLLSPHLGWVWAAIGTNLSNPEVPLRDHEISTPSGRLSFYYARLDAERSFVLAKPRAVRTIPVGPILDGVRSEFPDIAAGTDDLFVDGRSLIGIWLRPSPAAPTVWALLSADFPHAAPLVAVDHGNGLVELPVPTRASSITATATTGLVELLTSTLHIIDKPEAETSKDER